MTPDEERNLLATLTQLVETVGVTSETQKHLANICRLLEKRIISLEGQVRGG